MAKTKEWKNITRKLNELTGKGRGESEIKLAWKRMKLAAKANVSAHKRAQTATGGGEKPPSPSAEDLEVMAIAPQDFIITYNDYDSDAMIPPVPEQVPSVPGQPSPVQPSPVPVPTPGTSSELDPQILIVEEPEEPNYVAPGVSGSRAKKINLKTKNISVQQAILDSNAIMKKRQMEMMEEEHELKKTLLKLKIKKIQLELSLLEGKRT
ncbi:hypothetical protein JYU34_018939 [Plutella xylostella]|uniref:Regulatory protein zeste n=1 Tax=Plutella xylostella TaxID=51655 RepID=A0ABQ7PZ34_PLUXY|nr:hypothetical protein JYU34_018939 [Plutella xylostella]